MDIALSPLGLTTPLRSQLLRECHIMLEHALASGKELPQPVRDALEVIEAQDESRVGLAILADLHSALLRVVAPATPGGLALIREDLLSHRKLHVLGPVPSIRYLMAAACLFSVIFFLTSLSSEIRPETLSQDIFNSSGYPLAVVLLFLVSAAGLGATFGALFDVYQYISSSCYDTKFDSVYWARIGLGLVSGLMLAELIPQAHGAGPVLERPLLALLGGFSAAVVHRILNRLVGALESVFVPASVADPAASQREIQQRVAEEGAMQRTSMAKSFDSLLDRVATGGNVADARKGLVAILAGQGGGLTAKLQGLATDAAIGIATGGLKGAEQRVIADLTGRGGAATSIGGMIAGAVLGQSESGILGSLAGSAAQLVGGGAGVAEAGAGGLGALVGAAFGAVAGGAAAPKPAPAASAVGALVQTIGGAALGATPAGLIVALVSVGCKLGAAEYERWVTRVLGTPYRPTLLPAETVTADSAIAALRRAPLLRRVFAPELEREDRLGLQACAKLAAADDAAFVATYAGRFASQDECEVALAEFRHALLDRQVAGDIAPLLPADGLGAAELLEAVDASRDEASSAAELDAAIVAISQGRNEGWDEAKTLAAATAKPAEAEPAHA